MAAIRSLKAGVDKLTEQGRAIVKRDKHPRSLTYLNIADPTEISKEGGKTPSSSHKLDVTR